MSNVPDATAIELSVSSNKSVSTDERIWVRLTDIIDIDTEGLNAVYTESNTAPTFGMIVYDEGTFDNFDHGLVKFLSADNKITWHNRHHVYIDFGEEKTRVLAIAALGQHLKMKTTSGGFVLIKISGKSKIWHITSGQPIPDWTTFDTLDKINALKQTTQIFTRKEVDALKDIVVDEERTLKDGTHLHNVLALIEILKEMKRLCCRI